MQKLKLFIKGILLLITGCTLACHAIGMYHDNSNDQEKNGSSSDVSINQCETPISCDTHTLSTENKLCPSDLRALSLDIKQDPFENSELYKTHDQDPSYLLEGPKRVRATFKKTARLDPAVLVRTLAKSIKPLEVLTGFPQLLLDKDFNGLSRTIEEMNKLIVTAELAVQRSTLFPHHLDISNGKFSDINFCKEKDTDAITFVDTVHLDIQQAQYLLTSCNGDNKPSDFQITSIQSDLINRLYWCSDSIAHSGGVFQPDFGKLDCKSAAFIRFFEISSLCFQNHVKRIPLNFFTTSTDFPPLSDNSQHLRAILLEKENSRLSAILFDFTGKSTYINFSFDNINFYDIELSAEFAHLIKDGIYEKKGRYKELEIEISEGFDSLTLEEQQKIKNWLLIDLKSLPVMCHSTMYYGETNFKLCQSNFDSIDLTKDRSLSDISHPNTSLLLKLKEVNRDAYMVCAKLITGHVTSLNKIKVCKQMCENISLASSETVQIRKELNSAILQFHDSLDSLHNLSRNFSKQTFDSTEWLNTKQKRIRQKKPYLNDPSKYKTSIQKLENIAYWHYGITFKVMDNMMNSCQHPN